MLFLPDHLLKEIEAHGEGAYPHEGCGLLLGRVTDQGRDVQALYPAANVWPNEEEKPIRFLIAPEELMQAEVAAMERELDVVGIFHSHPDHEPVASPRDLAWATWPNFSYLITAIRRGAAAESRSWLLREDRTGFDEEPVDVAGREI